jgi:hypothetical protein
MRQRRVVQEPALTSVGEKVLPLKACHISASLRSTEDGAIEKSLSPRPETMRTEPASP